MFAASHTPLKHSLCLLAFVGAGTACANELGTFYELGTRPQANRYAAGFAVLSVPRYDGADTQRVLAVPALSAQLANGFFAEPVNGIGFNLGAGRLLQWGVRATVETGRSADLVPGLGRIDARLNPGVFANWRVAERWELRAALRTGMAGSGGMAMHLGGAWDLWRAGPSAIGLNAAVRWSDADYNQAYFGITPSQSLASGLSPYSLGSGLSAVQAGISGRTELAPRWTGFGGLAWQRLTGDAASSPLVRERNSPRLVLGAAYSF